MNAHAANFVHNTFIQSLFLEWLDFELFRGRGGHQYQTPNSGVLARKNEAQS